MNVCCFSDQCGLVEYIFMQSSITEEAGVDSIFISQSYV